MVQIHSNRIPLRMAAQWDHLTGMVTEQLNQTEEGACDIILVNINNTLLSIIGWHNYWYKRILYTRQQNLTPLVS